MTANGTRSKAKYYEENILAILDVNGVKEEDEDDIKDDKMSFISAVRAICLTPDIPQTPTWKMYRAVFHTLEDSKTLELNVACYQLLEDLDKHFPRVYLKVERLSSTKECDIAINREAWSPFNHDCMDIAKKDSALSSNSEAVDNLKLFSLMQNIESEISPSHHQSAVENGARVNQITEVDVDISAKVLLLVFLLDHLQRDFSCRYEVYNLKKKWPVMRNSILNSMLGTQRTSFINFIRSALNIIATKVGPVDCMDESGSEHSDRKMNKSANGAIRLLKTEIMLKLYASIQELLIMMTKLDDAKKEADEKGWTTRADGSRTPVVDIIIEEISYNSEIIHPFFQAVEDLKWKLNIILNYFSRHLPRSINKVLVGGKDSDVPSELFKLFTDVTNVKQITRRLSVDVVQMLLTHIFEACLAKSQRRESTTSSSNSMEENTLKDFCKLFIGALRTLQATCKDLELASMTQVALYVAGTILS